MYLWALLIPYARKTVGGGDMSNSGFNKPIVACTLINTMKELELLVGLGNLGNVSCRSIVQPRQKLQKSEPMEIASCVRNYTNEYRIQQRTLGPQIAQEKQKKEADSFSQNSSLLETRIGTDYSRLPNKSTQCGLSSLKKEKNSISKQN
ncbi:hypothetical protein HELRODRAFT_160254 [Helobdella robusta]|uniref:Uncharacterized protein n=1 Tax=Helobdella robusta TaxID=6412 RepID=T1EQ10_HELRO|nr:hypothetical protein HELRODRAFT_160254 [Helobdella robusta]ESO06114.1 hypothetical protein HELRODRAFT_160254 [Helobdella robusta]